MKAVELEKAIHGKKGAELFSTLYGEERALKAAGRYGSLLREITGMEGVGAQSDFRVFSAPGRTEICGNHTDHNGGKVIAASVHLDIAGIACPRDDQKVVFRSKGFPDAVVDLSSLSPRADEEGTTEALIRGIAAGLQCTRGFTVCADSQVPPGSGLSSSAACEVFLAKICDSLNGKGDTPPLRLAEIAQAAENRYFGKPCGLMDQAVSSLGGTVMLDFGENPVAWERLYFNPEDSGFILCVVNTGGSHDDLTADYASIPADMKSVAKFCGKEVLGKVKKEKVLKNAAKIRAACGDRALLRAIHFFNENERVDILVDCLRDMQEAFEEDEEYVEPDQEDLLFGDDDEYDDDEYDDEYDEGSEDKGLLMTVFLEFSSASGNSSWELLQNVQPSGENAQTQNIALALGLTQDFISDHDDFGGYRVHGGGFAGTIQAYIYEDYYDEYKALMENIFGAGAVTELSLREAGAMELKF